MFIEILFKILLFKGGVLIYAEQCVYIYIYIYIYRERERERERGSLFKTKANLFHKNQVKTVNYD